MKTKIYKYLLYCKFDKLVDIVKFKLHNNHRDKHDLIIKYILLFNMNFITLLNDKYFDKIIINHICNNVNDIISDYINIFIKPRKYISIHIEYNYYGFNKWNVSIIYNYNDLFLDINTDYMINMDEKWLETIMMKYFDNKIESINKEKQKYLLEFN